MGKFIDLTGQRFGKLTVIKRTENRHGHTIWECLCDCGKKTKSGSNDLKSGNSKSCGCSRLGKNKEKMIGKRFGKLIVQDYIYTKNGHAHYSCKCDCGNNTDVETSNLKSGTTKSCGCLFKESIKRPYGEASFNVKYKQYEKRYEKRGLEFDISKNFFRFLTSQPCFYCGEKPNNICKNVSSNGDFIYSGLDRIDSSIGYIPSNVVACCKRCNQAKNNMPFQEFILWIERVYNHSIKNKEK